MNFIVRNERMLLIGILVAAAILRLTGLGDLPPMIDESGHLALLNPIHPTFFELGKVLGQYIFGVAAGMSADGIYALRLLIALFGLVTIYGVYMTARLLGGPAAGVFAAALWGLQPYVTFHDRLAIHDPMISMFHIWSVYVLLLAMQRDDVRLAAGAGVLSGLALLVKIPLVILVGSCLAIGLFTIPREEWLSRKQLGVAFAGGLAATGVILIPSWGMLFRTNVMYQSGLGAAQSSAGLFFQNLGLVFSWLSGYNSIGFVLAAAICGGLAIHGRDRMRILLLALFVLPVVAMSWVLGVFYARYILAALLPLTLLMALTIPELLFASEPEGTDKTNG